MALGRFSVSSMARLASAMGIVWGLASHVTRAEVVAWDDFESYPVNSAVKSRAGGVGWVSEWSAGDGVTIVDASISYSLGVRMQGGGKALKLAATAENALQRTVPADVSGRDYFVSFIFRIEGVSAGTPLVGNVFSGWQAHDGNASVNNDSIGVVGAGAKAGARVKGTTAFVAPVLEYGRTYFFVIKYTGWNGSTYTTTQVWLNPTADDEFTIDASVTSRVALEETGAGSNGFLGVRVRTVGLSASAYHLIDELRVGTSWRDVVAVPLPIEAPRFADHLIVFGDSLSSGGRSGTPATGPLPTPENGGYERLTWIQQLSPRLGYGVLLNSHVEGGTNYALGGDTTSGMVVQVTNYLADAQNTADPTAVYVLWCGPNDISHAVRDNLFNASSAAQSAAQSALMRMEAQIRRLAAAGARRFVWGNLPDLSKTPAVRSYGALGELVAGPILRSATNTFNNGMAGAIDRLRGEFPEVSIHVLDAQGWFEHIIANKTGYGFTNVSDASSTSNSNLFYDDVHPTSHGHAVLAHKACELFVARGLLPPTLDALERWRLLRFGSAQPRADGGNHADPDGNGVSNLLEYALGRDPQGAAGPALPEVAVEAGRLALKMRRVADPLINYRVEATTDFGEDASWSTIWSSTGTENISGEVQVLDESALANARQRYLRLRVERPVPASR